MLIDERGEAGTDINDDDPKSGEEEPAEAEEAEEGEQEEEQEEGEGDEEEEAEPELEPEPTEIERVRTGMQKRIDTLTAKTTQLEKQTDLYAVKTGDMSREEYAAKHQEYPKGYEPKTPEEPGGSVKALDDDAIWGMVYDHAGHEHNGKSLADLHDEGGASARFALGLFNQERDRQAGEIAQTQAKAKEGLQAAEQELETFGSNLAKNLYEKDTADLSKEEIESVNVVISETLGWMKETGRGAGNIMDAYLLKNHDKLMEQAAKGRVKDLFKGIVAQKTAPSVKSGKAGSVASGYEADAALNRDQMAAKIEDMSDSEYQDWKARAPDWFKKKFLS